MSENQELLEQLKELQKQKKSKKVYAEKLGISEDEVSELLKELRETRSESTEAMNYISELEDQIISIQDDFVTGKRDIVGKFSQPVESLEDFIIRGKIDTTVWNIDSYIQNIWGDPEKPYWQVKAKMSPKTKVQNFTKEFITFLSSYTPQFEVYQAPEIVRQELNKGAALVINKQDEHLNKFDVDGENDINKRFENTFQKLKIILDQARLSNKINKIYYIIGSDEFNSEWTSLTTKGTPQTNALPYQEGFRRICDYELRMIGLIKSYTESVEVIYVPGNHDEYVGWHLISWLKAFLHSDDSISFDERIDYTKTFKYGTSAMMFNHGDAQKPAKLASSFPMKFKEGWSSCDNYYIFTGDKHTELSMEIDGIRFYRVPALSGAKSLWDKKNGYDHSKPELTAFVIDESEGITSILKQPL